MTHTIDAVQPIEQTTSPVLPTPTCALCHTLDHTLTSEALAAGATWRCVRCGQMWSGERLATAAAYARR